LTDLGNNGRGKNGIGNNGLSNLNKETTYLLTYLGKNGRITMK